MFPAPITAILMKASTQPMHDVFRTLVPSGSDQNGRRQRCCHKSARWATEEATNALDSQVRRTWSSGAGAERVGGTRVRSACGGSREEHAQSAACRLGACTDQSDR